MSDTPKLKIEYADKSNAYRVDNTAQAVTAENMNEIKEVVNNLSDKIGNINMFPDLMRYVRFIVPDFIKEGEQWNFEVQLSKSQSFTNPTTISLSSQGQASFYIFGTSSTWTQLASSRKIGFSDVNASIKIDIRTILANATDGIPFFGRYRWVRTSPSATEKTWKGFVLGSYGYFNEEAESEEVGPSAGGNGVGPYDRVEIRCFDINGLHVVDEKSTHTYKLYGVKANAADVDLTADASFFTLYDNVCTGTVPKSITFAKTHTDIIDMIIANVTVNNFFYEACYNVVVKAKTLERIVVDGDINEVYVGDSAKSYTISAFYSDGSAVNVTNNAIVKLLYGSNTSTLSNGSLTIPNVSKDMYAALVAEYKDTDFSSSEICRDVRYVKIIKKRFESIAATLSNTSFNVGNPTLTYTVKGTKTNESAQTTIATSSEKLDVTIINGDELKYTASTGTISLKDNSNPITESKTVTVIFKYNEDDKTLFDIKQFTVTIANSSSGSGQSTPTFTDFSVVFSKNGTDNITSAYEKDVVSYKIYDDTNAQISLTTDNHEIFAMPSDKVTINLSGHTLTFGNFRTNETVFFKFRVTKNGKTLEKIYSLPIKSINLETIGLTNASGDFIVSGGQQSPAYALTAQYSNGIISSLTINGTNPKIIFAAGNSNALNSINNNRISFGNDFSKDETLAFNAEYKDADFPDEVASKMFTVKVLKVGGGSASTGGNGSFYYVDEFASPNSLPNDGAADWTDWTNQTYYYVGSLDGITYYMHNNKYLAFGHFETDHFVVYLGYLSPCLKGQYTATLPLTSEKMSQISGPDGPSRGIPLIDASNNFSSQDASWVAIRPYNTSSTLYD